MLTTIFSHNISAITQLFTHLNSGSVTQLIKGKSRDLKKLLKYFNGRATSIIIGWRTSCYVWLIIKISTCCCLVVTYLTFTSIISHHHSFHSVIIPQSFWCHRIIVTVFLQVILRYNNINIFCTVSKCVTDFWYWWSKRSNFLES